MELFLPNGLKLATSSSLGLHGRHLAQNIGVLTTQEFILVVISSVIGFLLIVALVIMVVLIMRSVSHDSTINYAEFHIPSTHSQSHGWNPVT